MQQLVHDCTRVTSHLANLLAIFQERREVAKVSFSRDVVKGFHRSRMAIGTASDKIVSYIQDTMVVAYDEGMNVKGIALCLCVFCDCD
jgi:hypothetical protein